MTADPSLSLAIVDDDEGARSGVARLLRCLGHQVQLFESAEAFEAADGDADVDCVIVDVRLPGVSGLELRDRLRDRGSSVPIVFITGDSAMKTRDTGRFGAATTVVKPFDDETLLAAIACAMWARNGDGGRHAG
jgi:FixJ family two-component response regulator